MAQRNNEAFISDFSQGRCKNQV